MYKTYKAKKTKKSSRTKSSKSKLSKSKYCCPDRKNKTQCSNINQKLNYKSSSSSSRYAIMTLLFDNDSYLPGILLLGSSIRKVMPTTNSNKKSNIELCCMVTNDISLEARSLILKIYDHVIDVDYLQIPPNLIKHTNPSTHNIYSKTFTKLRIFEMTQYDKILFLDANMLVIKEDIFSLFNLQTPAAVFMGKLSNDPTEKYFKNEKALDKFKNKYCNWKGNSLHGKLIPYDNYENERISNGMNIESSVLLITPNLLIAKQRDNYLKNIRDKNIKMSRDTEMISRMFKNKIYAIEPRFFGRWVNPEEHPELVVLDLYGNDGKPWDIMKYKNFLKYGQDSDITYWWKTFMATYKSDYEKWNNKMLNSIYKNIGDIKNIYKTNINIDIGNCLSNYFYYLGLSILKKTNFKFEVKNENFIKKLPSFIKYNHDEIYNTFKVNSITLNTFKTKIKSPNSIWFMDDNFNYNFWLCMKDLVYTILNDALIKSNLKKKVDYPVIHFRCADTPFVRNSQYHFQKYKFYKEILDKINIDTNKNYKKVILLSCSFHRSDDNNKHACETYTNSLSDYLKSINYEPFIECNKNIEDFATLFYAPAVISIGSSFSFMSGFFGKGKFYSGGHIDENDKKSNCTLCNKWLITDYDVKHSSINDYYDTKKVISILQT